MASVDQVGYADGPAGGGFHQMEASLRVYPLPVAQLVDDVLHFLDLVAHALPGVDVGNVDDGLLLGVEYGQYLIGVGAAVEVVAEVERLEVLIAVELLVVGVGDGIEFCLVLGQQHRIGVAPEVGAGHGDDVGFVPLDKLLELRAQHVILIGADVVEFINGNQAVVEGLDAEALYGKTESGVGAYEHLIIAFQERLYRVHLAAVFPRRIAEVPLRLYFPIVVKAKLSQRLIGKAGTDGPFRHGNDSLLDALPVQLVQRNEHQRPALARGRGRLE